MSISHCFACKRSKECTNVIERCVFADKIVNRPGNYCDKCLAVPTTEDLQIIRQCHFHKDILSTDVDHIACHRIIIHPETMPVDMWITDFNFTQIDDVECNPILRDLKDVPEYLHWTALIVQSHNRDRAKLQREACR